MPLGEGYTVEEQLTGTAKIGGLQFDFFDRLSDDVLFSAEGNRDALNIYKTPLKLDLNSEIIMKPRYADSLFFGSL